MFLPLFLLAFGGVFGSDHCPGKLPSVLKDETGVIHPDNSGNKFFITFLENSNAGESVYSVFVTTRESGSVGFTVIADSVNFRHEGETLFGSVTTVHVPTSLTNLSQTLGSTRTVVVQAEEGKSIILYGLNEQSKTTDAFLGLPYLPSYQTKSNFTYLACSYVAISVVKIYSLLAIVPQDTGADTKVNIRFRIQNLGTDAILYSTLTLNVSDGDMASLTLSISETVYIRSEGDLTGTVIHSDRPLSIFSGSTCTVVPFPKPHCDHLVEQIPPVSTWGTRFVTVPLKKRENYDVFRFIAAYNCTDVTVSCVNSTGHSTHSSNFTLGEGLFHELQILSSDYCIVRSTNRLLVVQYSVGTSVDGVLADPFMAVLPPVDQYSNNYTFATPGDEIQTYEHFINLVIPVSFFQPELIILDGRMLSTANNFVELKDGNATAFYAIQIAISGGAHTLIHTNLYAQFGLLVYGFGFQNSYGYPGAYSLGEFNIDLYNLNVVNASDKCISVLWDHPPDVTPGTLTYNVVLRDGDHIVNEITTKDTQVIVCDLCSRSVYTVSLSSTNDTVVNTQAGDATVRVRTNGLLGLTLSDITQTGANATCSFQHPLDTADAFCLISCTLTQSADAVEYRYKTPQLQNSLDHTHTLIKGLDPDKEYTCTAIAVGVGCGCSERYNATIMFTTLKDSLTEVVGAESQNSCSIGLGIPLAIALILLVLSVVGNMILIWYFMIRRRKRSKVVHIRPPTVHKVGNDSSNHVSTKDCAKLFRKSEVPH